MSFKRIAVRIVLLLILWASLFGMFTATQGMSPWIRVILGIVICLIYGAVQVAINRRMYK